MAKNIDKVSAINDVPKNRTIIVRVIRMWGVPEFKTPDKFRSLELVLMDSEGSRIHATIKQTLIYLFQKKLTEGAVYTISTFDVVKSTGEYRPTKHDYKLDITYNTKVIRTDKSVLPDIFYSFTPPADVFKTDFNRDFLIDVIGVLNGIGREREYIKNGVKTKLLTVELNNNGYSYQLTLFGNYVDELNSFLANGESTNAVVGLLFAKSKIFQGKPVLQNSINASKLIFNPEIPEAMVLKTNLDNTAESPNGALIQIQDTHMVRFEEDMLSVTPRTTIKGLQSSKLFSNYVVIGTISDIIQQGNWWYTAHTCSKKVYQDDNMWYCKKCTKHVVDVTPRYLLKLEVTDETGTSIFLLFDQDAIVLLNKSCADLIESHNPEQNDGTLPKPIADLVGQSFLFKVEKTSDDASKFGPSYKIKKLTRDDFMLKKFKGTTITPISEELDPLARGKGVAVQSDVAEDLMPRFSETNTTFEIGSASQSSSAAPTIEVGPTIQSGAVVDLDGDSEEAPHDKRSIEIDPDSASTVILKKVKIEKE